MTLTGPAALILAASLLVVGCSSDDSCDDVDALREQVADTERDDPDFNDLNQRLLRAEADCNAQ